MLTAVRHSLPVGHEFGNRNANLIGDEGERRYWRRLVPAQDAAWIAHAA